MFQQNKQQRDQVCSAFLTSGGEEQPFPAALAATAPEKQGTLFETVNTASQDKVSPLTLEP